MKYTIPEIEATMMHRTSITAFWMFHPFSVYLTWIVVNFTNLTPNHITLLGFLTGIISAWCFYTNKLLLGATLFLLAITLDWVDGKVARVKGLTSALGCFLDSVLGALVLCLNLIAITWDFPRLGILLFAIYFMIATLGVANEDAKKLL